MLTSELINELVIKIEDFYIRSYTNNNFLVIYPAT